MNKHIDKIVIGLFVAIFVALFVVTDFEKQLDRVTAININISQGDSVKFITREEIFSLLSHDPLKVWHENFNKCDVSKIEEYIAQLDYVDSVNVYKQLGGFVNIDIVQKDIWARIITPQGDDFYISNDFHFFATKNNYVANVPVVSCSREILNSLRNEKKKINKNYLFIESFFIFVKLVEKDQFWRKMISQINLNDNNEVEFISRIGSHTIILCDRDDLIHSRENIAKLRGFYSEIMPKKSWTNYNKVNLKFKNLVVISKE